MKHEDKPRHELICELDALRKRVNELETADHRREETEQALEKTLITQTAILDNIPDMAWLKDKDGRFLAVNRSFEEASGISREDLRGKTDFDFWPQSLAQRYREDDEQVMKSRDRKRIEESQVRGPAGSKWIETIKSPIFNEQGEVIGTTGIARDVTERKQIREELERALAESNRHLAEAAEYVRRLLPEPLHGDVVQTDWRFVPSASLGGDSFGYHWLDDDHFALYLVDVCGHGVRAALLSVTITNVLRSRTLRNTDFLLPDEVLKSLNAEFPMEEQNGMYFTIWYGVLNKRSRDLVYAGGGHPPALLFTGSSGQEASIVQLHTPNLFIGGMPDLTFEKRIVSLDSPSRVYVFSDGVYEVTAENSPVWSFTDFSRFMTESVGSRESVMDRLLSHLQELNQGEILEDDFSIGIRGSVIRWQAR
ncbi:MAG: SpoIIE family protein phosphatase [Deltaproteobacteria bacterium]